MIFLHTKMRFISIFIALTIIATLNCDGGVEAQDEINNNPSFQEKAQEFFEFAKNQDDGEKGKTEKKASSKPNIIYFLFDDLGYNDLGYQNPDVITPNIDELANTGLILDYNYVAPVCTPSRHTLMSGTYAWKQGMHHFVLGETNPACSPLELKFLPERLKEAGYQTHMMGKWHLGFCDKKCTPAARGFDSFTGLYGGHGTYYTHSVADGYDWHQDFTVDFAANGTYSTDIIADRGLELLSTMDPDKPFFWYVSHMAPHTPLQVENKYFDMYSDKTFSTDSLVDTARKIYLAMMTKADETIGELIAEMKSRGLYDNTVFIFSSDNGGEFEIPLAANNSPLRGGKASLFEGGSRVVGFVHSALLPSSLQGQRSQEIIHEVDWVPTLTHLAKGEADSDAALDGLDQYDTIFNGAPSPRNEVVYNIDMSFPQLFGQAAIRVNEWKLIWGHYGFSDGYGSDMHGFWLGPTGKRDLSKRWDFDAQTQTQMMATIVSNNFHKDDINSGLVMLFNLDTDPSETNNLAADPANAGKIVELKTRLLELINNEYKEPLPGFNQFVDAGQILAENGAWNYGWCQK